MPGVPFRLLGSVESSQCMHVPWFVKSEEEELVRALSLDVTWLLALITGTLAGCFGGAVSGEMAYFAAVVALLTLGAVARHVAVATAGVAGLTSTLSTAKSTTVSALVAAISSLGEATCLWAVACDMSDL